MVEWLCEFCLNMLWPSGHEETTLGHLRDDEPCKVCDAPGARRQVNTGTTGPRVAQIMHAVFGPGIDERIRARLKGNPEFRRLIEQRERTMTHWKDDASAYETPALDLKGWWLVDAPDGHRWIGKLVAHHHSALGGKPWIEDGDPPLLEDELVLFPSFEVVPDRITQIIPVPKQGMVMGPKGPEQGMSIEPQIVTMSQFDMGLTLLTQSGVAPQRVRRTSMRRVSDWGPAGRGYVRKLVAILLEKAKPETSDALKRHDNGSREKVQ